jgi:glycerol-3-phosphate cytidylyltransferase-like family protein
MGGRISLGCLVTPRKRQVIFDEDERARLATACKVLGITFEEFAHRATMQALDEFEADVRHYVRERKFDEAS